MTLHARAPSVCLQQPLLCLQLQVCAPGPGTFCFHFPDPIPSLDVLKALKLSASAARLSTSPLEPLPPLYAPYCGPNPYLQTLPSPELPSCLWRSWPSGGLLDPSFVLLQPNATRSRQTQNSSRSHGFKPPATPVNTWAFSVLTGLILGLNLCVSHLGPYPGHSTYLHSLPHFPCFTDCLYPPKPYWRVMLSRWLPPAPACHTRTQLPVCLHHCTVITATSQFIMPQFGGTSPLRCGGHTSVMSLRPPGPAQHLAHSVRERGPHHEGGGGRAGQGGP